MRYTLSLAICLLLLASALVQAQAPDVDRGQSQKRRGGPPTPTTVGENPQDIGDAGVAWYTTWETGLAEAKRSNRPILFMSAATTCSGIPGVF